MGITVQIAHCYTYPKCNEETIEAVKPFAAKGLTGIFHCFGDRLETANKIIDMGFYAWYWRCNYL